MTRLAVGSFRVDLEALESCVAGLTTTEAELETLASDLTNQLARLHEGWQGEAAAAHSGAQAAWERSLHQLQEALAALRTAAAHAHASYGAAASANRTMWSQLD